MDKEPGRDDPALLLYSAISQIAGSRNRRKRL